jgi:GPH family glycoside/pentoside/hexuronide:cation symporter
MKEIDRKSQQTAPEDRVPIVEKTAYGALQIPNNLSSIMPHHIANQVFNMSMGIAPSFVTIALAIFRLVDAFTDLFIGWLSDGFKSRWGRRRPFMLVGLIGMAIFLPMLFQVNREMSTMQVMTWFVAIGLIYYLFDTMLNVPYQSLGMEMSPDYNERTSIQAFRSVAAKLGTIGMGWLWYLTQLPVFADPVTGAPDTLRGAQGLALIAAGILLVTGLPALFLCKERYYNKASETPRVPFINNVKMTFANKPFRMLILMVICMQVPNLVNGLGLYMSTYYVFDGVQQDAAFMGGIGNTISSILAFLSVPVVTWLSRRFGKEVVLRWIILANLLVAISMFYIYNPDYPYLILIKFILAAPLVTGLWLLLPSMQADIVDLDEMNTGERREGSFASVFSWILKFSGSFAFGFSGVILDLVGFDVALGSAQQVGVYSRILGLLIFIPIVATIIQWLILRRYPITPQVAWEIRTKLESRRGTIG